MIGSFFPSHLYYILASLGLVHLLINALQEFSREDKTPKRRLCGSTYSALLKETGERVAAAYDPRSADYL